MPQQIILSISLAALVGSLALACQNAEKAARYVKQPLENVEEGSLPSLDNAYREANTRLASVRSDSLRERLSKDLEQDYQRLLVRVREVEQARAAEAAAKLKREQELERQREAEQLAEQQRAQQLAEQQRAQQLADQERAQYQADRQIRVQLTRQAILDLETGMRPSALDDGTQVLVLRNAQPFSLDFDLRCFTRNDRGYKTLFVSVPARGVREIGFLEGWPGNFVDGERCEALYNGERLWNLAVH